MSVDALSWVFSLDLPPVPKLVMISFANNAGEYSECRSTIEDLEDTTGFSRDAIEIALNQLEADDMIIRHRVPNKNDALPYATFTLKMPGRKMRRGWE